MSCANCGVIFGDGDLQTASIASPCGTRSVGNRPVTTDNVELPPVPADNKEILKFLPSPEDTGYDNTDEKSTATKTTPDSTRISIMSALSMIFEISPLRFKQDEVAESDSEKKFHDSVQVFQPSSKDTDVDTSFVFCSNCGESLTLLYNSFRNFVQILKLEGELGKKLKELQERRDKTTNSLPEVVGPPTRKKRGRPKTKEQTPKEEEGASSKTEDVDGDNLNKKGRRHPKKLNLGTLKRSASGSDIDTKEYYSFGMKQEELILSDYDSENDDFPNYKRFRLNSDDDDSTPPDSPINLDPEPRPRSPRPVRQSSARNKDWSSYYKDEEDYEDEDDLLPLSVEESNPNQNDDIEGDGNETEVTATEAEGDDEDDGEVPPDVETILGKVEVDLKEGYADDDSDEDYAPDSDLENLLTQDHRSTKDERRKKLTKSSIRRVYECDTCGKLYAHLRSLQIHHRTHLLDNDELYPCEVCYKDFPSDELLKRHRRQFHGEYIPYRIKNSGVDIEALIEQAKKHECPICHELFERSDLMTHVSEHNVEYPWQCTLCPCALSTLTQFTRHKILFHHQRPKFSCDVCLKNEFRSLYHLRNHQAAVHNVRSDKQLDESPSSSEAENNKNQATDVEHSSPKPRKQHKCSECDKKYARLDSLKEHLITHGIGDKFKCTICGREFTHDSSRKRHMLLHVDTNQYQCMEVDCNKAFSRKDHLSRHMDSIHGIQLSAGDIVAFHDKELPKQAPKAKEIPCPYCSKLVKRERMRLHLVSHTGEKKHLCPECGHKFGLRTTLRTHIKCVHQDIRRHACTFCSLAFKRSNHLKDHMKLHTEADNKPFQCDQCSKSFRREKNLKSHMVTHYGGKDYMCEQCGKAFNRIDNMKAHVRAVHQGLQIRKRKPPSTKNQRKKEKKIPFGIEIPDENAELEDDNEETDQPTADLNLTTMQDTESAIPSVIMKTTSKKPSQRKRGNKSKQIIPPEDAEIETETLPTMEVQIPPPGTIVTLGMGNVISADALAELGAVQIQEIHGAVEGEGESFEGPDGQRTTILQLAPGQVFPGTSGQYETTYYQYTYYHQE